MLFIRVECSLFTFVQSIDVDYSTYPRCLIMILDIILVGM